METKDIIEGDQEAGQHHAQTDLEERYNKLKIIAVKLKKKVSEHAEEIETLKTEKGKLLEKSQTASRIQQEYDKALDEIESLKKNGVSLQKDLKASVDLNVKLKETNLENTAQIQGLNLSQKSLREKVEKLEKENVDGNNYRTRIEELEKDLKEAKVSHSDAQQEKRQTAILSLEITDYEKKLHDSHVALEDTKRECDKLNGDLQFKVEFISNLEESVSVLKESEDRLTLARDTALAEVGRKTEKITFLQEEITKLSDKLIENKSELQAVERDFETTKLNFSNESKELVERCSLFQKTVTTLEHKISALEENRRNRESHIANLKLEMQQLESEYTNYKVKAQAMLKSQKPIAPLQPDTDELENLQKIVQDFNSEISLLKSETQTLRLEKENLNMERSDLTVKVNSLKTEFIEKEVALINEIQKVKQEMKEREEQAKLLMSAIKVERDAGISTFKDKLQDQKITYEGQIRDLKEQVELLKATASSSDYFTEFHKQPNEAASTVISEVVPEPVSKINNVNSNHFRLSQQLTVDTNGLNFEQVRMIPRGECEGSESISSSAFTPRVDNNYISFEQLLSSSFDSVSKVSCDSEGEKSLSDLKEELVRSQNQVKHLTSLLHEAESNGDRLTQLSEALKEEIRRIERESERREHLKENTEYLKNIVLKFMTLGNGDERTRLIPVLKTMLRLTQEEVNQLEGTIKAKSENAQGWSSYLPLWSSGEK